MLCECKNSLCEPLNCSLCEPLNTSLRWSDLRINDELVRPSVCTSSHTHLVSAIYIFISELRSSILSQTKQNEITYASNRFSFMIYDWAIKENCTELVRVLHLHPSFFCGISHVNQSNFVGKVNISSENFLVFKKEYWWYFIC